MLCDVFVDTQLLCVFKVLMSSVGSSPNAVARRGGEHRHVLHGVRVQGVRALDGGGQAKDYQLHGGPGAPRVASGPYHGDGAEVIPEQAQALGRPGQNPSAHRPGSCK